jgi:hypothetical protein
MPRAESPGLCNFDHRDRKQCGSEQPCAALSLAEPARRSSIHFAR